MIGEHRQLDGVNTKYRQTNLDRMTGEWQSEVAGRGNTKRIFLQIEIGVPGKKPESKYGRKKAASSAVSQ